MAEFMDQFLDRVPSHVADSFTPEQRAALYGALKPKSWSPHPVNIRLTIPFFGRSYFLTIVAGHEKRSKERLRRQKRIFPLQRVGNILFLLGLTGLAMAAAFGLLALVHSVIEF